MPHAYAMCHVHKPCANGIWHVQVAYGMCIRLHRAIRPSDDGVRRRPDRRQSGWEVEEHLIAQGLERLEARLVRGKGLRLGLRLEVRLVRGKRYG